jgi:hypothetical protein
MHDTDLAEIIIGIDTHKEAHAAVAINGLGARLGGMTLPASRRGYQELEAWAHSFGSVRSFGIEGTGSYGAGLSRFLQERGHRVIEVNCPNRQIRHQHGKTNPLDAENAARAVLSGHCCIHLGSVIRSGQSRSRPVVEFQAPPLSGYDQGNCACAGTASMGSAIAILPR